MDRQLNTEQIDQLIAEHTKQMNYFKRFDKDMYRYHRNELRKLLGSDAV